MNSRENCYNPKATGENERGKLGQFFWGQRKKKSLTIAVNGIW
jgi:hypothetical protein